VKRRERHIGLDRTVLMRWGFYFPDQHARLFSRNAATPSCASAAMGAFGHDLSSIRVRGRLIDVNLPVVSLFTDLDNEWTRLGDPVGPVSERSFLTPFRGRRSLPDPTAQRSSIDGFTGKKHLQRALSSYVHRLYSNSEPARPNSVDRQNRMWRLTLLGALLAVAVTQSANSSYSASALHLATEYC
jgi:hypothetical protein